MKKTFCAALIAASFSAAPSANAVDFDVQITNLSNGIYFTPFLVAEHPAGNNLFMPGQPASDSNLSCPTTERPPDYKDMPGEVVRCSFL